MAEETTLEEYAGRLPDGPAAPAPLAGAVYGLYEDHACTKLIEQGETAEDDEGYASLTFRKAWCGGTYYVKEIGAPAGYELDETVYAVACDANDYPEAVVDVADVPNGVVTVHFLYRSADGPAVEVHSERVDAGSEVSASDAMFAAADEALSSSLSLVTLDYTPHWYEGTADGFDESAGAFESETARGDIWLWAKQQYGRILWYVDGTDDAHLVELPDGSRAEYKKVPYGTKVADACPVDEILSCAAREGCTPGLAAWYTDPSDPMVTEHDVPEEGAAAGAARAASGAEAAPRPASLLRAASVPAGSSKWDAEAALAQDELRLYSVNRATVTFAYCDGSLEPAEDGGWLARAQEGAPAADVSMPPAMTARVDAARALPARSKCYRELAGGRWRSAEPECWYADPARQTPRASSAALSRDSVRYIYWSQPARDGVVDRREG